MLQWVHPRDWIQKFCCRVLKEWCQVDTHLLISLGLLNRQLDLLHNCPWPIQTYPFSVFHNMCAWDRSIEARSFRWQSMPLTFLYTCSSFPFVSIRIHRDTWLPTFLFITFPEEKNSKTRSRRCYWVCLSESTFNVRGVHSWYFWH